jgi:hypothetical protein
LCCYTNDPTEALNQTITLNLQFSAPLRLNEVEKATKSAHKAWEAKSNEEANRIAMEQGYPGAGYNVSNKKLIRWLDISSDEMEHLQTIIDVPEKNRRKRIANMETRRQQGVKTRDQYLQEEKRKTMDKLDVIRKVLEENPEASIREIARITGFSKSVVQRQIKFI